MFRSRYISGVCKKADNIIVNNNVSQLSSGDAYAVPWRPWHPGKDTGKCPSRLLLPAALSFSFHVMGRPTIATFTCHLRASYIGLNNSCASGLRQSLEKNCVLKFLLNPQKYWCSFSFFQSFTEKTCLHQVCYAAVSLL